MLTIACKNYKLTLKAQEQLLLNELKWSLMNDDDNVDSEEDDGDTVWVALAWDNLPPDGG